jgi:transcriptional regulator GlxA family with amidase domain
MNQIVQDGWVRDHVNRGLDCSLTPYKRQVAILLLDGFSLSQAGRLAEVFNLATHLDSSQKDPEGGYNLFFVSTNGGAVQSSSGLPVWTEALETRRVWWLDALFVFSGTDSKGIERDDRLFAWLRHIYPLTSLIKGVRAGESVLEAAGLGFKDTENVHARCGSVMGATNGAREGGPSEADDEDTFGTALALVKRDFGYKIAQEISRRLSSISELRPAVSTFESREIHASERIRKCTHWLRDNCEHTISMADAARLAAMSERNFLRRFKQELGVTPSGFVLGVRLEKASAMLAETDLPVDKIARRSGLGSGGRLTKLFRQHLSMSPTEYRLSERRQTKGKSIEITTQ